MASWRDQILKEFTPQVARLTLVADPDRLLTEDNLVQEIQARGFELIPFEDPIAFRFAYESKYRDRKERGELTDLVVVLRLQSHELRSLPYDLLQAGRQLSFSLRDLFPNLSYPIVNALDCSDLDALYQAQTQYSPEQLGDNATKDFLLRHVFDIAPELIKQARQLEEQTVQKVALLVLDGLALDQWLVLQKVLAKQRPQLRFRSEALFAYTLDTILG